MLSGGLPHGRSVIAKSTRRRRITESINVFEFELSINEMATVSALDTDRRA